MSGKKRRRIRYFRRRFEKHMQIKLVMVFLVIILAFIGLTVKVTHINASNGEKYTKIILNQQKYNSRVIPFKRGDIVDRNGTTIAYSERVYNVVLDAHVMLFSEEEDVRAKSVADTKKALKKYFQIDGSEVDRVVEETPDSYYNVLKKKITYKETLKFKEEYKGSSIWLEEVYIRTYPYSTLASDVIGFTSSGNVGKRGIEQFYNSVLNGIDGREYGYLDTDSLLKRTVKESVDGKTVMSTIDISLQSIVEKHILAFNEEHKNEARTGDGSTNTAVIIMNPNTAEILAEASYPNYDLNNPGDLTPFYTQQEIDAMSQEDMSAILNVLWDNFCVSDIFEPGSTAKPFTVAAGLESGKLAGNEVYFCGGSLQVGGWTIGCHKREGHGNQTLSDAIANSCNVSMMKMVATIGVDEFCKYQSVFGFGQETGIDLPKERTGWLYDEATMDSTSLATNSFGQNFNVTMTQMIAAYASLINGGNYYKPHVVKQILDSNGNVIENKNPVLLKKTISEETSIVLREYMKQTMTTGTGKNAQVPGYSIGAKTGTAQKYPREDENYLLSYMGFAPAENPEVLIYVVIDEPNVAKQDTSQLVTDLARNIMAEAFPYLDITRDE